MPPRDGAPTTLLYLPPCLLPAWALAASRMVSRGTLLRSNSGKEYSQSKGTAGLFIRAAVQTITNPK